MDNQMFTSLTENEAMELDGGIYWMGIIAGIGAWWACYQIGHGIGTALRR